MSMWLMLAKIEVGLLDAVRADPDLLAGVLGEDESPMPEDLSAAFDAGSDLFEADYRTLSAIAEALESKEWFDQATGGTESLDYEDFTYGPAFALSPRDVSAVAAGLVADGWPVSGTADEPDDEFDDDIDLAGFFIAAANQGRAVVGGIN
ncbi:hypothetical protein Rhe02_41340 [Rhizocola hellebori]|uniref:Uncharacterized protein n=1 Tax=Rhizocola hellebori TaxID=1392758 RepID=A0A8J3QA96_9ACTN|nr:hypothetical protein [Rhizocola hellebori]GIH06067.1 hypothetical protein Rhe02_41340 [Rhizocola hellebori]